MISASSPEIVDLDIARNTDIEQEVQLVGTDGAPLNIAGDVFTLDVKFRAGDPDPPIASADVSVTDAAAGKIMVALNGSDFGSVEGVFETIQLAYDLIATRAGKIVAIMRGNIMLQPAISLAAEEGIFLLSGDQQSGADGLLLSGDAQSGADLLLFGSV